MTPHRPPATTALSQGWLDMARNLDATGILLQMVRDVLL